MFTNKNLCIGIGRVRNTIVLGVLLAFGVQMPFVNADEANIEPQDALQLSMSRNQVSFDQKMSGMQDGLLQEHIFRAEMMLDTKSEFSMREVELAVDGSADQQKEYAEDIETYSPPAELAGDAKVCFVKSGVREC